MIALPLAALGLAACTAGGTTGNPTTSSTTAASEVEILAVAKEVAQCIRDNGLPGLPDPYFENGELTLPPLDANVEQQGQAILEGPCREIWQRLEAVLPEQQQDAEPKEKQRGPMSAEDLEKLKLYTDCMRRTGYPNWPDPDETGHYHLSEAGLPPALGKGETPEDARFRDALTACEQFAVPGMGLTS